jgi:NitT/TauT family transport system permease protein
MADTSSTLQSELRPSSDVAATRTRGRRFATPHATIAIVSFILIWQIASVVFNIPTYLLPSPLGVVNDAMVNWRVLLHHTGITTLEVVVGFVLSVLIGLPLAALFTFSRTMEKSIFPLIVGSNTIPKVALAPLLLAWFGFGLKPKILIVVLVAFFPIVINAVVGFKSLSPQMIYLARSMGATPNQLFWQFYLPNALPNIFAGFKVATSLAVIGAVVAEFVGADGGLGYVMMIANADLNIARQFAAIVVLSMIGMVFFWAIELVERIVLPWHVSVRLSDTKI